LSASVRFRRRWAGTSPDAGYAASKAGLNGLIRWLGKNAALEEIYVNGVAPGPVNTRMTDGYDYRPEEIPLERLAEPEDVAECVAFLGSQMFNYVTGTILDVNGGLRPN
jgi:3-oxoacyl-[acyl-carrier protein] reductase